MSNLWNDEEENFSDMPEEAQTGPDGKPLQVEQPEYSPPSRPRIQRPAPQQEIVEEQEESEFEQNDQSFDEIVADLNVEVDTEENYEDILNNADLRLEQGNLYRIIMNHDLFAGSDADPKAVRVVQAEIRKFAKEKMEVMLGMKQETSKVEHIEFKFPFNVLEVKALKSLASAATKGASEYADNYVPEVIKTTEEVPVVKKASLNPIGQTKKQAVPAKPQLSSKPVQQPLRKGPAPKAPVKQQKKSAFDQEIDRICREEGVPRELLEENIKALKKPPEQLTDMELLNRNKEIAARRRSQAASSSALPMATFEQMEALASSQAAKAANTPGFNRILATVMNAKK